MNVLEIASQRHMPSNVISTSIEADTTTLLSYHSPMLSPSMIIDEENSESKVNGVITPLSLALRKGADNATLRVISHAFPDALSVHDDYGLTPLSFCCQVYQRSK
jgi:hypothetical protein